MSTTTTHDWHRCTPRNRCAVCGGANWCGYTADGALVRCMRGGDTPTGYRHVRDHADGGRLYALIRSTSPPTPRRRPAPARPSIDWSKRHAEARGAVEPGLIADWSDAELGLPGEPVDALLPGWLDNENCAVFPERDEHGKIIGLVKRTAEGKKIAMKDSRRGLTFASPLLHTGAVVVVEGASDTAAAMAAGLAVVGRPSAKGGGDLLAKLLAGRDVVIVAENDRKADGTWPGREGAEHIARQLVGRAKSIRLTYPPDGIKDIRNWLGALQ